MKITIQKTEKNVKLFQALGSKSRDEALKAQESMAAFIGPVIQEVINNAPTLSNLFETFQYNEFDSPSIPLDIYTDITEGDYLRVWSQMEAGGLAYNFPTPPTNELKFHTYKLDSAVAFSTKFARQSRMDIIAKTMTRLAQEVMLKQEKNSAAVLLTALAKAKTATKPGSEDETSHVIRSHAANELKLQDFLKMFTLHKRIRSSWNKGTPSVAQSRGLTDLLVSPEMIEQLRGLAFEPMNIKAGVVTGTGTNGAASTAIPLTDGQREAIFRSAGIPEFYGVNIMEINELGIGYKYNDLFGAIASSASSLFPSHWGTVTSASAFNSASEEILLGLDLGTFNALIRPVATDSDTGSEFTVQPDDQFVRRAGKVGFFGSVEEGRVCLDDRVLSGLIV